MKKIILILALLLFPSFAWAQCTGVFPNNTVCGNITGSSSTPRPTAYTSFINNLTVGASTITGGTTLGLLYNNAGVLGNLATANNGILATDGSGNPTISIAPTLVGGPLTIESSGATSLTAVPTELQVLTGNSGAPITTGATPTATISRYEAISTGGSDGSDGPALYVRNKGSSVRQPVAIVGYGETTNAATSDVVGLYGVGINNGTGAAFAGFFATQNNSTGSNLTIGTNTANNSGSDVLYNPNVGSKVVTSLDLNYTSAGFGTHTGGPAIQIRAGTGKWDVGVAFMKGNFINTASIQDDTNSPTLFLAASGSHTSGIKLDAATFSGNPFSSTGFSVNNAGIITGSQFNATGSGSGTVSIIAQATAGTPTLTLPNASGTFGISGTSPITLNATTGAIGCATCLTANQTITLSGAVTGSGTTAITTTLATAVTNTVKGNATSGTASPTDLAVGSCSTASSALIWTTNTGFGCNTSITANAVPAANLTGSTLAAGVTASSLTSLGTITSFSATNSTVSGIETVPTIAGGNGAASTLTLESTSGSGTTDSITLKTGSQVARMTIVTGGSIGFGTETNPQNQFVFSRNSATGIVTTASHMFQIVEANGTPTEFDMIATGNGSTAATQIGGYAIGGTIASPLATPASSNFFQLSAFGYANGALTTSPSGKINIQSVNTWSASDTSTQITFQTTPTGSTTRATAMTVQASGGISVGTATDPGIGSLQLNAQFFMPNITTSSAAQTGTVCWTTGTGKFTVDTTVGCLTSIMGAKNITERLSPPKALGIVTQLDPFAFRYKKGWGDSGRYEQFGFGAEEVASVDERLVGRDPEGNLQGVRYQEMTAVLAGAIQKLKADNDNLEERLTKLERKL